MKFDPEQNKRDISDSVLNIELHNIPDAIAAFQIADFGCQKYANPEDPTFNKMIKRRNGALNYISDHLGLAQKENKADKEAALKTFTKDNPALLSRILECLDEQNEG